MPNKLPAQSSIPAQHRPSFEIYALSSMVVQEKPAPAIVCRLDYCLIWVKEGTATLFIDSQPWLAGAGALFCIRPGHTITCTASLPVAGYVIGFSTEFLDVHDKKSTELIRESLFNHFLLTSVVYLHDNHSPFLQHLALKMLQEFVGQSVYKTELLKGLFKLFIIYTGRLVQAASPPQHPSKKVALVKQFYVLVEKHFAAKKMVRDYAAMLQVSAGYLNEVVREATGFAASYHIQQQVIREAKRRIFFEGCSMKEIAFSLGFTDQAHFSKYFRNITGKNFTDFKNDPIA